MESLGLQSPPPIQSLDKRFEAQVTRILYDPYKKENAGRQTVYDDLSFMIVSFPSGPCLGSWVQGRFLDFFDEAVFCKESSWCAGERHIYKKLNRVRKTAVIVMRLASRL